MRGKRLNTTLMGNMRTRMTLSLQLAHVALELGQSTPELLRVGPSSLEPSWLSIAWVITSSPTVFISSSIFSTLTRMEPESATLATAAGAAAAAVTAAGAAATGVGTTGVGAARATVTMTGAAAAGARATATVAAATGVSTVEGIPTASVLGSATVATPAAAVRRPRA